MTIKCTSETHKWHILGIYMGEGIKAVCTECGKVFDGRTMPVSVLYE